MTESSFEVPVVDISPYVAPDAYGDGARRDVAGQWDEACRTVGFVQVLGHGVPADAIDGLTRALDAFFNLEVEAKTAYKIDDPAINRGYTPPKSESLSLSLGVESANRMNDFFEAFNVGVEHSQFADIDLPKGDYAANTWPDVRSFRPQVEAYFAEAARVARVLTRICADALGLRTDFFAAYTDHSCDVLRMNNYALPERTVDLDGDLVGMGEHTDYGIVTVLWADQIAGLQVLGDDGRWHDVMPADDALLVNLGDLTAQWTNEIWHSTLHRVKPPIVDGQIMRRRSAAYFHDGNIDALIDTIPSCISADNPRRYGPVTVGEHVRAKLAGSRAGVLNTEAEHDAARVRAAL